MPIFTLHLPQYASVEWIVTFAIAFCVLLAWDLFAYFTFKNKRYALGLSVLSVLYLVSLALGFEELGVFLVGAIIINSVLLIIRHAKEFKPVSTHRSHKEIKGEILYDQGSLVEKINSAVIYFSRHKIGALITFEKKDDLNSEIATGVKVDAPVSVELLQTIFYVGTRLHDGAVIIRGDKIVAASCLYQPSTKPVSGKMGLRHRAAMGISEKNDSLTVVVSEETGRISLARGGELENVTIDDFKATFAEALKE